MKVLVTGGAGYVGSVLVDLLLAESWLDELTIYDTFRWGVDSVLHFVGSPRVKLVKGDIRNKELLRSCICKVDVVLHLAALVGFPICAANPEEAEAVNVGGSRVVADLVSPSQVFVYASTGSTYGLVNGTCTEETPIAPLSLYGKTKAEAETICRDKEATCLRFATVFGVSPCMRFDLLVNSFVFQAIRNKYIVMYEGHHRRTFLHVCDAARAYLLAIQRNTMMKGSVYNVGSDNMNFTKREVADAVNQVYPVYIHEAEIGKDQDKRDYQVSYTKLSQLGYHTRMSLNAGIREVGSIVQLIQFVDRWRVG